jgi:hypothetical protein
LSNPPNPVDEEQYSLSRKEVMQFATELENISRSAGSIQESARRLIAIIGHASFVKANELNKPEQPKPQAQPQESIARSDVIGNLIATSTKVNLVAIITEATEVRAVQKGQNVGTKYQTYTLEDVSGKITWTTFDIKYVGAFKKGDYVEVVAGYCEPYTPKFPPNASPIVQLKIGQYGTARKVA